MSKEKLLPKLRFEHFKNAEYWTNFELGELANIVRGASPRPIQDPKWFDKDSTVGWLRISDVTRQNGRIYYLDQRISKAGQEKTRVLKSPHLLISIAATVGKPVINYVDTGVHDGFLIFKDPIFDKEFMYQWLEMFRLNWFRYGQPGSQINLNSNLVKNQNVYLPLLQEQEKIGKFFVKLDELIQLQQSKVNKVKDIKSAYLSEMFPKEGEKYPKKRFEGFTEPWHKNKFNEITEYITSSLSANNTLIQGRYELYDANELIGYTNSSGQKQEYVTIIKDGSGVGRVRLLPKDSNFIGTMGAIVNKEQTDIHYIYAYLQQFNFTEFITGATVPHVYYRDYGESTAYHPSYEEQVKIGKLFNNLDNQISIEEEKLTKLENLKQAYLNDMFI
ncbi:restriction endonuclease subunit S [Globicatella sanguinis]|uniref:restriction endonuclease subunit S n=1 Tax=Globicatella sanguinis TaxID=13076 RepID=UPI0008242F4F|nr:restriction endonuclease subunit S [Globicatella sanguinis]